MKMSRVYAPFDNTIYYDSIFVCGNSHCIHILNKDSVCTCVFVYSFLFSFLFLAKKRDVKGHSVYVYPLQIVRQFLFYLRVQACASISLSTFGKCKSKYKRLNVYSFCMWAQLIL